MRPAMLLIFAALCGLATFGGTSHAASLMHADDGSMWDLLSPIYQAFAGKHYEYAGALVLVLAVAVAKRYGAPRYSWLRSDSGGALLVLLGSMGATLSATLAGGAALSWDMVWRALSIAVTAAGGYTVVKHLLIVPLLAPLAAKLPARFQAWARAVLWIFDGQPAAPAEGK